MPSRLHAGIDYGTSASKVVLRDYGAPGGERCHVVLDQTSYRHPSSVAVSEDNLVFGRSADELRGGSGWRVFESVKMRMLGHFRDGYEGPPHRRLTWSDLAIGSVWCLLSSTTRLARALVGSDYRLGMTLGVPRAFIRREQERGIFLDVARVAWRLLQEDGPMVSSSVTVDQLQSRISAIRDRLPAISEEQAGEWIRSEAEAAMWWAFRSPSVGEGPYAKFDIGAGTTNASVFRITSEIQDGIRVKTGLAFFGAHSEPCGMDDICWAIYNRMARTTGDSIFDLRGRESALLVDPVFLSACALPIDGIERVFREAWRQMWLLNRGALAEMQAWGGCSVAFVGGGSVVAPVVSTLGRHPIRLENLPRLNAEAPGDLLFKAGAPPRETLPFLLVAYGLSTIGLEIPHASGPDDVQPMPTVQSLRKRVEHEDIYGNG